MSGTGAAVMRAARQMAPTARIAALVSLEQRIAALQAEQLAVLAAIDEDPVTVSLPASVTLGSDKHWAIEDVAAALHIAPGLARSRLSEAVAALRAPRLFALLADGAITLRHVQAFADQTLCLDDQTLTAVETRVLAGREPIGTLSLPAFRTRLRKAVLIEAAPTMEEERRDNVERRRVWLRPAGHGITELLALLPDEDAAALMTAVQSVADRADRHDPRTADQRRADALTQLGTDSLAGRVPRELSRQSGLRPAVHVTVALSTLLALDEQPGELAGIGPIPAALARRLAHDPTGSWRRLVFDELGTLRDYGRRRYRPPAPLARHVAARDRTCRFPHCRRNAARSELDHTVAWAAGGTTSADNLTALCSRHHHLRHDTGWRYRRIPNGDTEWTDPTGAIHIAPAATYPTDATTERKITDDHDPPPF